MRIADLTFFLRGPRGREEEHIEIKQFELTDDLAIKVGKWLKRVDCETKSILIDQNHFNDNETKHLSEGLISNKSVKALKFTHCEFHHMNFRHMNDVLK
jgi:hypothetical protein